MNPDSIHPILRRERARCDALLAGDVSVVADLLSDRLLFAHANATYDDKASLLDKLKSRKVVYKALKVSETRIVDLGDTALLMSRLTAAVEIVGTPKSIDNQTLSVWTKEGDDWRLVAYQPTAILR